MDLLVHGLFGKLRARIDADFFSVSQWLFNLLKVVVRVQFSAMNKLFRYLCERNYEPQNNSYYIRAS
jgi:hypothetical protein